MRHAGVHIHLPDRYCGAPQLIEKLIYCGDDPG
jgi:hypothetical protein